MVDWFVCVFVSGVAIVMCGSYWHVTRSPGVVSRGYIGLVRQPSHVLVCY